MRSGQRLDRQGRVVGSRARVKQPKLLPLVWTVTNLEPGRSFVWKSVSGTVRTIAGHRLDARPEGAVRLTLSIQHTGPLASLIARLYAGLTLRYLRLESEGLKGRCEAFSDVAA